MKKHLLSFLILPALIIETFAQSDTAVFNVMKKIEANEYVFSVPEKWNNIPQVPGAPQLERLEFNDVGLPHIVNNAPLVAYFLLRKLECDSLGAGTEFISAEFNNYSDKVFPAGYNYLTEPFTVASGEQGIFLTVHYYRRSKVSNYSCYHLIVYSEKRKATYMLSMFFQHKDASYNCEFDLKLKRYATKIFKTLVLR